MVDRVHSLDGLVGKHGLINEGLWFSLQKSFIPSGLISVAASGKNLRYLGCSIDTIEGAAIYFNKEAALYAAVGEYFERFFGATINYEKLIHGSYESLTAEGLPLMDPSILSFYSSWQFELPSFPFKVFNKQDNVYWIKGHDFFSESEIYIPAFLAYWVTNFDPKEGGFHLSNTTGHASGTTLNNALKNGFLEVMERHAFCNFWYGQNERKFVTYSKEMILENYGDDESIIKLFKNNRIQIKVFDLGELSAVETILIFIFFTYKNKSYYSVGCSSRFNKKDAIVKACLEAYQGVNFAIYLESENSWDSDYKEVLPLLDNFDKHFNFYNVFPELRLQSPVFREAMNTRPSTEKIMRFNHMIPSFQKELIENYDEFSQIFYVNLTPENFPFPFHTAKLIIPKASMLTSNHKYPYLANIFGKRENLFLDLPHCFP